MHVKKINKVKINVTKNIYISSRS